MRVEIFLIDHLKKGQTGQYYESLLGQLSEKIKDKRPHLNKKINSFIKTMHGWTRAQFRCLKLKRELVTIHRICVPVTSFISKLKKIAQRASKCLF